MVYTIELEKNKLKTISDENAIENEKYYVDYIGDVAEDMSELMQEIRDPLYLNDTSHWFHGPYLLFIYNKQKKTAFVTSHMFGAPVPVYYVTSGKTLYITTSLSKMKALTKMNYKLNKSKIPDYLMNGYIEGNNTLVQNVFKLPQGKGLYIGKYLVRLVNSKISFSCQYSNVSDIHDRYERTIETAVRNNIPKLKKDEKYFIALSGGFDSNSILHFLRKIDPDSGIQAVSIGGEKGRNEAVVAAEIVESYDNVDFDTTLVTPETFSHLDEIVERLEGNVFEIGVFLQYELSKLLREKGCNNMICGECADQVFHKNTYTKTSKRVKKYSYENTPLEMAAYTVLKKSTYMLNSFGIRGYYPFLDYEMIAFGHDYKEQNGVTKEVHKAECKRILKTEVSEKLIKQGGTTQMMALFGDDFDALAEARKSKFFDARYIPNEYGPGETERVYYAWLRYLESFEKIYCNR